MKNVPYPRANDDVCTHIQAEKTTDIPISMGKQQRISKWKQCLKYPYISENSDGFTRIQVKTTMDVHVYE